MESIVAHIQLIVTNLVVSCRFGWLWVLKPKQIHHWYIIYMFALMQLILTYFMVCFIKQVCLSKGKHFWR